MNTENFIVVLCAVRILLGLAPMLAAGFSARLLGFPDEHDNATTRLMARLFGVRDIGLGVLGLSALFGPVPLAFAILFNLATDLADAVMIGVPLFGRQGIDRAAKTSLLFAATGASAWAVSYFFIAF